MGYLPRMQNGRLDKVTADHHGLFKEEAVELNGVSITPATLHFGTKWSNPLRDSAGTASFQLPHLAPVFGGALCALMNDDSAEGLSKNEVMLLPPGHDA